MAKKNEIADYVTDQNDGSVVRAYGPVSFHEHELWEVWVRAGTEFYTRFVTVAANGEKEYFDDFATLAPALERVTSGALDTGCRKELGAALDELARLRGELAVDRRELAELRDELKRARDTG